MLHRLLDLIHTDVRHLNFFVASGNFSRALISCTQTLEFGLRFVGCSLEDGCPLRQRFVFGVELRALTAQLANFSDRSLIGGKLPF
ncbi:hypothetical protein VL23_03550 [Stenotrophomonas maltophilia]|uniref:Uncharacterized protein n=1 Tax=Stenotrophomonas maltophilia TaxID=40324 RepID=A0AB34TGW9_STEMA|nr:hypothetical protein VL23_03550 [Stenotrophomonas maltophilia]